MGGWKKDFVEKNTPILPISGWMGDNLLKKSDKMTWWSGMDVLVGSSEKLHVTTLYDVLNALCRVPERPISAPMRMPISGIYKIKGVGDVLAGRVEQGAFQPQQPLVCDTFKNCEGLSRVAFMDGNGVVMLGKIVTCE